MAHLTVHIALDDQTLDNGALHWVPGSHKWTRDGGPLPQAAEVARDKMQKVKAELVEASREEDAPAGGDNGACGVGGGSREFECNRGFLAERSEATQK